MASINRFQKKQSAFFSPNKHALIWPTSQNFYLFSNLRLLLPPLLLQLQLLRFPFLLQQVKLSLLSFKHLQIESASSPCAKCVLNSNFMELSLRGYDSWNGVASKTVPSEASWWTARDLRPNLRFVLSSTSSSVFFHFLKFIWLIVLCLVNLWLLFLFLLFFETELSWLEVEDIRF